MSWTVNIEHTYEKDGVPRATGGRFIVSDAEVDQAAIGGAAFIGMIAEKVYEDMREAMGETTVREAR